jgi:hypothetical protein
MRLYKAIKDGVEVARKADNVEVMEQLLDSETERANPTIGNA